MQIVCPPRSLVSRVARRRTGGFADKRGGGEARDYGCRSAFDARLRVLYNHFWQLKLPSNECPKFSKALTLLKPFLNSTLLPMRGERDDALKKRSHSTATGSPCMRRPPPREVRLTRRRRRELEKLNSSGGERDGIYSQ